MANEIIISSDSRPYKSLITDVGNAKMTLAILEGRKVNIVEMRLGDGGGSYYMPTADATDLVNEVWRGEIASKTINEASPNIIAVKTVIPSSVGGFTVREASLHDDEGDMIAVCNMPDIGKSTLPEGISTTLDIVMNILLANVDAVDFIINPTLDPASREELEQAIRDHNADPGAHGNLCENAVEAHNADPGAHPAMAAHIRSVELALNGSVTLTGDEDPTSETVGKKGQHYINPQTGKEFVCTDDQDGTYTWEPDSSEKSLREILEEAEATAKAAKDVADGAAKAIAAVQNMISVVPSQSGTLTYNKGKQKPSWSNFATEMMEVTYGEERTPAESFDGETEAGHYTAYFKPKDNYTWGDKSKEEKAVTWTIQRATIATAPSVSGTLTYNESPQSPTWKNFNEEQLDKEETPQTNAGQHSTTFTPKSNYQWTGGDTSGKTVQWSIGRAELSDVPSQSGTLTYSGGDLSPNWTNYEESKLTLGGTKSATDAGTYQATFTPTKNYQWSGGDTAAKTVNWTIGKAAGSLKLDKNSIALNATTTFSTITVTRTGTGTISATSSDTKVATVQVSGETVLVMSVNDGTTKITVKVAEGKNHTAPEDQTCTVTASVPHIYGATWDGSSTTKWTRTDAAAGFVDPVPYVAGSSNYGSPFDNLQPWAGMVKLTRTGGTMVAIPKFWYKLTQSGKALTVQIADKATDGFSVSPAHMDRGDGKGERDVVYIGRYHCATSTYKSTTKVKPQTDMTRSKARTQIHNIGDTIWQSDFAMRFTLWLLYIIEFADWNSQKTIGRGRGNGSGTEKMGYTDAMPYHTGTTQADRDTYGLGTQYRNIEGLWDNVRDWTDGCYNNSDGFNIILNPNDFSDTGSTSSGWVGGQLGNGSSVGTSVGIPSSGYPSAFTVSDAGGFPMFYPSEAEGSETTYSCDAWNYSNTAKSVIVGGSYVQGDSAGLFFVSNSAAQVSYEHTGSRIQELP